MPIQSAVAIGRGLGFVVGENRDYRRKRVQKMRFRRKEDVRYGSKRVSERGKEQTVLYGEEASPGAKGLGKK